MRPPPRDFPWWLVAAALLGAAFLVQIATSEIYTRVLTTLMKGVWITVMVTVVAFVSASALGLGIAMASLSRSLVLRQIARFYVEIVRGVPIIVLLLYVAFVLAPALVAAWNWATGLAGLDPIRTRDFPLLWRAVMALSALISGPTHVTRALGSAVA